MNSFSGKRDLRTLLRVGAGFHGFGELFHNIVGRDGVDFGGAGLWNLGGDLIGSGGCLCCVSLERSDLFFFFFIGSGR
jgi:hypothetical protein